MSMLPPTSSGSTEIQHVRIIKHFKSCGHLDTFEARDDLGICAPAARILELKEKGFVIVTYLSTLVDSQGISHPRSATYFCNGRHPRC